MNFEALIKSCMASSDLAEKQKQADELVRSIQAYRIVIYGAGAAGTMLLSSLRLHRMEPVFFIDRRWKECDEVDGAPMYGPEKLAEVNSPDTLVILAINAEVIQSFNLEPLANIKKYCSNAATILTGFQVSRILRFAHCCKKMECGEAFPLIECLQCGTEVDLCHIYYRYLQQIAPGRRVLAREPSKKFDWFGCIMGQYCSLKCRNCCEHIPYLPDPVFSDYRTILSDCAKIAASSEFIRFIELVGGEPFLHPHFKQVLEGLLQIENVGYIKIFTNGTIVPEDDLLDILEDPRILINLSNYTAQAKGRQLESIYGTIAKLNDRGIRYLYSESKEWTDWGDFHDRGRTDEELTYNAAHCHCYNGHRLFQGKLYRCPHQYAGVQRGILELIDGEYIDLNGCGPDDLARKLDAFEDLPFTDGCRRCDMPFDCPVVPAGVQVDQ